MFAIHDTGIHQTFAVGPRPYLSEAAQWLIRVFPALGKVSSWTKSLPLQSQNFISCGGSWLLKELLPVIFTLMRFNFPVSGPRVGVWSRHALLFESLLVKDIGFVQSILIEPKSLPDIWVMGLRSGGYFVRFVKSHTL